MEYIVNENKDLFDLILISDCLYKEAPWEKLLASILFFTKLNPLTEIIFAFKKRYVYQEQFLKEAGKYIYICLYPN
jgi:hypothetical protein